MKRRGFIKSLVANIGLGISTQGVTTSRIIHEKDANFISKSYRKAPVVTLLGIGVRGTDCLSSINCFGVKSANYISTDVKFFEDDIEVRWKDWPPNDYRHGEEYYWYDTNVSQHDNTFDINASAINTPRFFRDQVVIIIADMADSATRFMLPHIVDVMRNNEVGLCISCSLVSGSENKIKDFYSNAFDECYMPFYLFKGLMNAESVFYVENGFKISESDHTKWLLISENMRKESIHNQLYMLLDMINSDFYIDDTVYSTVKIINDIFKSDEVRFLQITTNHHYERCEPEECVSYLFERRKELILLEGCVLFRWLK